MKYKTAQTVSVEMAENPQQISLLFISFVKNFEDEQENKSNSEEIMVKKSVSIY